MTNRHPRKFGPTKPGNTWAKRYRRRSWCKASKDAVKRKVIYLDSEKDFHDAKNLGIIIPEDVSARLVQKIGDNPATYYKDRTIRVVGKVVEEEDRCYIRLSEPEQIEVVETEPN